MKSKLLALTVLVACAPGAFGQSKTQRPAPLGRAEQAVAEVNRAWADAIARGDMETLDRLFADDMILTSASGELRNKAQEMNDLRPSADIKTYFFNTDDVRVRVYGDSAVVTGHAKWRINLKGRDVDLERRYTMVLVRQKRGWRIVAQHLSHVSPRSN